MRHTESLFRILISYLKHYLGKFIQKSQKMLLLLQKLRPFQWYTLPAGTYITHRSFTCYFFLGGVVQAFVYAYAFAYEPLDAASAHHWLLAEGSLHQTQHRLVAQALCHTCPFGLNFEPRKWRIVLRCSYGQLPLGFAPFQSCWCGTRPFHQSRLFIVNSLHPLHRSGGWEAHRGRYWDGECVASVIL